MKYIFYISFLFAFITSCSDEKPLVKVEDSKTEAEISVIPNKKMTIKIDGMVCKMGCGGSIRKELKAQGGISSVEFDFEEERTTNEATIYFDDTKISKKEIIEIVSSLNDKQFTVGATQTENYSEISSSEKSTDINQKREVKIDAGSEAIGIPNLIELFQSIIVG